VIKNNKFFLKNFKTVIFLGESQKFKELIAINRYFNIKTFVITSSDQSKIINKNINKNIFNNIDDAFKKFIKKKCNADNTLFVSLGARYIFKKDNIKNLFKQNLVNFHGSRLPLDAGGGGMSWKILREDRIDSHLVHFVDEGLDTGPIISYEQNLFPSNCRIPVEFQSFRLTKFLEFYKNFIKKLKDGFEFEMKPQNHYLGRYNPRLSTIENGFIDWNLNPYDLLNFINAFDDPYLGASTYLNSGNFGKLFIKKVQLHGGDSSNHPFMTGIVTRHDKNWIVVSTTGKHMLIVEKILDKNGKNIISQIKPGDRFFTPIEKIENSRSKRVRYSSKGIKS